jgi:predicted nucleic acid-binding Zn ribbon protein
MPGIYREKSCPTCGTTHRKKGQYCSKACSNSNREVSDNVREAMRKVAEEYNRTPEAIAKQSVFNSDLRYLTADDYAVDIPSIPDDYELPPGYERGEDW